MELLVAICDDNRDTRNAVESYLKWYFRKRRVEFSIAAFKDGQELLDTKTIYDVIILDIEMCEVDGITVKNRLFDKQVRSKIIFLTDYDSYMDEAFGKNVYAYVAKTKIDKLEVHLNIIVNEFMEHQIIKIAGEIIDTSDILYVEADDSYSNFHLLDKELLIRRSFYMVEEELIKYGAFIRIHRAYIINMKYIKQLKSKVVILHNGKKLVVSRQRKLELRERYFEYVRQMISDGK